MSHGHNTPCAQVAVVLFGLLAFRSQFTAAQADQAGAWVPFAAKYRLETEYPRSLREGRLLRDSYGSVRNEAADSATSAGSITIRNWRLHLMYAKGTATEWGVAPMLEEAKPPTRADYDRSGASFEETNYLGFSALRVKRAGDPSILVVVPALNYFPAESTGNGHSEHVYDIVVGPQSDLEFRLPEGVKARTFPTVRDLNAFIHGARDSDISLGKGDRRH